MTSLTLAQVPAVARAVVRSDALASCHDDCNVFLGTWNPKVYGTQKSIALSDFAEAVVAAEVGTDVTHPATWQLVYDVMRVRKQRVMFLDDHIKRIESSYRAVAPQAPLSQQALDTIVCSLKSFIEASDCFKGREQNLKFLTWVPTAHEVTSTEAPDTLPGYFLVYATISFFPPPSWYVMGTRQALLYNAMRTNPNAKVVQSQLRARAKHLMERTGVFEVLLVHGAEDDYLIPEGSRSNYVLATEDHRLWCSAESDILIGVTLQAVRRAAVAAGLGAVVHQRLTLKDLLSKHTTALAMLGTSLGTLPVREVLLYSDPESQKSFEAAVSALGIDLTENSRIKVTPATAKGSAKAVLELSPSDSTVQHLSAAYELEAFQ